MKFKRGYQTFWLQAKVPEKCLGLWVIARPLLTAFPSSYLVEKSFSVVTSLLTEKGSRFNITERAELRLLITKLNPNVDNLMSFHQVHLSHEYMTVLWLLL